MIDALRSAWAARSIREQRLLLVMFALLALTILWLGILRPLGDASSAARERLDRATVDAGRIAARAEDIKQAKRGMPAALDTPLDTAVQQAASAAGFELSRVDLQGQDRLGIAIAAARAPALFDWLGGLARRGVLVEHIAIRPNSDATLSVDATLGTAR